MTSCLRDAFHRLVNRRTADRLDLGIAIFPAHWETKDALLKTADAALYRAKPDGRDRVVLASLASVV